jgi:hypothetical protein
MRFFLLPVPITTGKAIEGHRHKAWHTRHQCQTKLLGQAVAQVGGTNLGDGQAAGGNHQVAAVHRALGGADLKALALGIGIQRRNGVDSAGLPVGHLARAALGQQHRDDVFGRMVRKQLALVLFVVGNAVLVDQRDKFGRPKARQCRAAELRVLADKVPVRLAHIQIAVGEVAAPAARDADLLCDLGRMVNQQYLEPALARLRRTKQAGSACANDDGIEQVGGSGRRHADPEDGWASQLSACADKSSDYR